MSNVLEARQEPTRSETINPRRLQVEPPQRGDNDMRHLFRYNDNEDKWGWFYVLLPVVAVFVMLSQCAAHAFTIVKDVPPGATIEFHVNGVVAQSAPLAPGRYRITVETVDGSAAIRPRVGHRRRTVQ
jgi:hypothetical protein